MACFLIPAGEAIVTTIAAHILKSKEKKVETAAASDIQSKMQTDCKIPFSRKLKWLSKLLWGGSALLAFEHVWHGEIQPWFPFLTDAGDPESASAMLHEMASAGTGMAVLVTAAWIGMLITSSVLEKRTLTAQSAA